MLSLKKPPETIELPPTEYRADFPNKREPIFNEGGVAWLFGVMIAPALIGAALKYFGLR